MSNYEDIASDLLKKSLAKGATAGDVVIVDGDQFDLQVRLGSIDQLSQAREKRVGLRLFSGLRSAVCSSSDFTKESLDRLVEDTFFLARETAEDTFSGLADPEPGDIPDLGLYDPEIREWTMDEKLKRVKKAEQAALDLDPRITNSEGAGLSHSARHVVYANTHGFSGSYPIGLVSCSVSPIATENGSMQRDFWYSARRPMDSADSRPSTRRLAEYQKSLCMDPFSVAIGDTEHETEPMG